tara:strand:+ start:339 stop:737 length:399 start_codon:yes stop_codon:yes gene_type:complete
MIKEKISNKQLFDFGLIMGFGLPIIVGFLIPFINGHGFQVWTIWVGLFFLVIGIIKPKILIIPYRLWMNLGKALGFINSKLILGLVFISVLIPISFLMKIIGHDPLKIKKNKNKKTYREINKSHKMNFERIF